MSKPRNQLKFEILLERYFSNLPRIILTNLLFFVPTALFCIILYFVSLSVFGGLNFLTVLFALVPLFPFYSGVVLVCRNLARGDNNVNVFSTFIKGIKDNFLKFLLYGFVVFGAAVFSYYSLSFYILLLSKSWVFYVILFVCLLIVIAAFFTLFYLPLMTVTFDLPLKYIFKNSFLMSFGELKNNFFATVSLAVVTGIAFTVTVFVRTETALIIILAVLTALLLPASCQFVVSFFVYDNMLKVITQRDKALSDINTKIDNKNNATTNSQDKLNFTDIDVSKLTDTDDYIYYNGRMVKQSYLLNLIKENNNKDV